MIGSVDTSEFLVALAASIGFLLALGSQGVAWKYVAALLIGGIAAAPLAAWLVRHVTAALLGASVGGLILVTNTRTLFDVYDVSGAVRRPVYLALFGFWTLALVVVVRRSRQNGEPLLNRGAQVAEQTG